MKLRPAFPEEKEQFVAWEKANSKRNCWDERILDYPLLVVSAAINGKVVAYLPQHPVLVLDSIAVNPEASGNEVHTALLLFLEEAEKCAKMTGMGEVMFLASDEAVARGAARRGFVKSDLALYRKVL